MSGALAVFVALHSSNDDTAQTELEDTRLDESIATPYLAAVS